MFERFSEPQPVGSGLLIQPSGQIVLDRLGLLDAIKQAGSPVTQLHGISISKNRRALDMQYAHGKNDTPAIGIHRASLFTILLDAVKAVDIPIIVNRTLTGVDETAEAIAPIFADGRHPESFDLLIDASGARTPLAIGQAKALKFGALWTTVDLPEQHDVLPHALDQRYFHASKMAGIMPVGLNPETGNQGAAIFWSVKPEQADALLSAGIERFRDDICDLWPEAAPFVAQIQSTDDLTMAVYAHRTGAPSRGRKVFHVGDSWHCTSPQLGQGANMALIDAAALADALMVADDVANLGYRYARARKFHISFYQTLSAWFTPLYQSDSQLLPWIRDMVIHHFARLPIIRNLIARTVSGTLGSGL